MLLKVKVKLLGGFPAYAEGYVSRYNGLAKGQLEVKEVVYKGLEGKAMGFITEKVTSQEREAAELALISKYVKMERAIKTLQV